MLPTPLRAFSDNYIWTLADDRQRMLVVDPGDAAPVLAASRDGVEPAAIMLTHHHDDHVGGVPALLDRWPGLAVFGPADERIPFPVREVGDGDRVEVAGWGFNVIAVAGHTVSHVAFHGHGLLFCGDTLFSLGCGRLFEGTPAQMLAALDRLSALPPETLVCCGHEYTLSNAAFARTVDPGNPALMRRCEDVTAMHQSGRPTLPVALASELDCNPFLRIDAPAVRAAVTDHAGADTGRVERFAALRRWKDGFRA